MVAEGVFATGRMSSYCTVDEVLKVLHGYDLSGYGDTAELAERIEELLPQTAGMIETCAGRDFRLHAGETVRLDGQGTDRVWVTQGPVKRPVQVRGLRVSGATVDAEAYHVYAETGLMRLKPGAGPAAFPVGVQNVEVELDWGFAEPPTEVALAQAKLTAAEVLAEVGGEGGAVQETRIGDYAVRYAAEGRYAAGIERLCAEAQAIARRYRQSGVGVV